MFRILSLVVSVFLFLVGTNWLVTDPDSDGYDLNSAAVSVLTVAEILSDTDRYQNNLIKVQGVVIATAGIRSYGSFVISDSVGTLSVYTSSGLPDLGDSVIVTGVLERMIRIQNHEMVGLLETGSDREGGGRR